jgi:hypothetical protein
MDLLTIEYGSLLSYSPRGESEMEGLSKTVMRSLKNDHYISNPPILMSDYISNSIKETMSNLPFAHFFTDNLILVPIPKSSLMNPGTLGSSTSSKGIDSKWIWKNRSRMSQTCYTTT